jgi:hypothetical protein
METSVDAFRFRSNVVARLTLGWAIGGAVISIADRDTWTCPVLPPFANIRLESKPL